ncbi:unnamed protein product, partial [marine sediment metagenome]
PFGLPCRVPSAQEGEFSVVKRLHSQINPIKPKGLEATGPIFSEVTGVDLY